jgi:hypothetical protein
MSVRGPKLKGRRVTSNGHQQVEKLPRVPGQNRSFWINSKNGHQGLTHHLFRFPAKFHPPVVRWALGKYARQGSRVLDPFTGSGTVQVEALVRGVSSIGVDVDPLACLIAGVKSTPLDPQELTSRFGRIEKTLSRYCTVHSIQQRRPGGDISEKQFRTESEVLWIPDIPNITHWLRRYVIIDLARILQTIENAHLSAAQRLFFKACFAATIRRVSNADPTPVSGLEVTCIQLERNRHRKINVFDDFALRTKGGINGMEQLWRSRKEHPGRAVARVVNGDVLHLNNILRRFDEVPLVITSPPYCQAVEYSRRHRLEMYWLRFLRNDPNDSILVHSYIGRHRVRSSDFTRTNCLGVKRLDKLLGDIGKLDHVKARAVRHYFETIRKSFEQIARVVAKNGTVVCVIGDSRCCNIRVPTTDFLVALVDDYFSLHHRFSYALRNHYMQYGLRNGDGIKQESVLILKPR